MKEYLFEVILEGDQDTLKTWADCVPSAIDNIVSMDAVSKIISIHELETSKSWSFKGNLDNLKKMRSELVQRGMIS
tara:strand:- start:305 stop:532 length:228 start_codon:yes stop_codon:yes gene_type:complete